MTLEDLEKSYQFSVEKDKKNLDIEFIKFQDGREYKLQHPTFFEIHDALVNENPETALLRLGLKCLFPNNQKTARIDDAWLEKNKYEGINLWSPLLRGLLRQP